MEVIINGTRYLPERVSTKDNKPFNELIYAARKAKNETLEEAAKGIGTTKSNLWALEKGNGIPRLPLVQKILKYYGLLFDEIAEV